MLRSYLSEENILTYLINITTIENLHYTEPERTFIVTSVYKEKCINVVEKDIVDVDDATKKNCFRLVVMMFDPPTIDRMYEAFGGSKNIDVAWIYKCLFNACRFGTSVENIDHVIKKFNIDVEKCITATDETLLHMASTHCTDLSIIQYFVQNYPQLINKTNKDGFTCLSSACKFNLNPAIVEFLIEKVKMDPMHKTTDAAENTCIGLACYGYGKPNYKVVSYFLENTAYPIDFFSMPLAEETLDNLLKSTKNYQRVIELAISGLGRNAISFSGVYHYLVKKLPKIALSSELLEAYSIKNPYDDNFHDFFESLNLIPCTVPLELKDYRNEYKFSDKKQQDDSDNDSEEQEDKNDDDSEEDGVVDCRKKSEFLFMVIREKLIDGEKKEVKESYFGDRKVVYSAIPPFREALKKTDGDLDDDDKIEIKINLIPRIMNMYITACSSKKIDIGKIGKPENFSSFLELLDGYPIIGIRLHSIEKEIVEYMIQHKIVPGSYIRDFAKKYELKHMCVYIHNFDVENE